MTMLRPRPASFRPPAITLTTTHSTSVTAVSLSAISLSPSDYMPDLDNLTRCIDSLHIWFCANGMAPNPEKTEAILLGTRQRAHSYFSLATVNVAGSQIRLADHIKILGVTLNKNLSMNNHVNAVCKSIHYHIHTLRHICSCISQDMAKMVACGKCKHHPS